MLKIFVDVAEDAMSASLKIELSKGENKVLSVYDLQKALGEKKIVFGIDESVLNTIVEKWKKEKKTCNFRNVVKGIKPLSSGSTDLDINVEYLDKPEEIDAVKNIEYCWQMSGSGIFVERVDKGTVIARNNTASMPVIGRNIYGKELHPENKATANISWDENVKHIEDKKAYESLITGVVYYIDAKIGVLPLNFDGSVELNIAPDKMNAELIIHPAMEKGKPPNEDSLIRLFSENNICYGINDEKMKEVTDNLTKGIYPDGSVVFAEGKPPGIGKDGSVEYLFDTETILKPKEDSSGNVDFKNVNIVKSVKENAEVARLIPPTEGEPGKNVNGETIPSIKGKKATLPIGINTVKKPDDEDVLIALKDGIVKLENDKVNIIEEFKIKGDVDYSTGNVEYDKSVSIKGDIKSGFSVNCGGDLHVNGSIEDSQVRVGGSLVCKYGFVGQGNGLIDCDGDVNLGFVKNQTIRCRKGNVIITKEAVNSIIYARAAIEVNGRNLSIAGGHCVARDRITCNVAGSQNGVETIIEVGTDFILVEQMEQFDVKISEILENKQKISNIFQKYERLYKIKRKLPQKEEILYNKLKNTINAYETQQKLLEDQKEKTTNKMYKSIDNALIKVNNTIMPGVLFKIGKRKYRVTGEISGSKIIKLVNFEIQIL